MTAVEFDPFSAVYFDDPYEMYRRLRDEAPAYYSEKYGFWAVSRWEDVLTAHREWQTFSSTYGVDLSSLRRGEKAGFESIIMMDPPKHDRLRALVSRVFTPRATAALEPMIRDVICGYLDALDGRTEFDGVAEFSGPFPVEIISRMLGVPEGERQQVRHWLDVMLTREPGEMDPSDEGTAAMIEAAAYFYELVRAKRAHPDDDMLSHLTQVEVDRGDGEVTGLDDVEIAGFATLLGGAGAETVTKLVGNALVLFDRNPDQWQLLLEDPEARIGPAVEEILRYNPPSQYQGRYSVRDMTLHGVTIPAGFPTLLITGAATRDERAFEDPDRFDITRTPALALGFGYGIHSCLGAALARMESRIAVVEFARRWPTYKIDETGLRRVHMSNVAGFANVPVHV
jgi:cytochrome P450